MSSGSHVRLGVLTRTFGLAGGVRLSIDGDAVPTIAAPCDVSLGFSESFTETFRLERYDLHAGNPTCYFAGYTSREVAEKLLDRALFVQPEFLSYDEPLSHPKLIGYEVLDESGEHLGTIVSIFRTPAHFIWMVGSESREWMVPAIDQFVIEIRHDERKAIVRPIPGMVVEEPADGEG
jgi:16S rRNA processing protein RimM